MPLRPPLADDALLLPSDAEADAHLARILARGSVNLGGAADIERLMFMLTRSCELRCSYCCVDKTETGPELDRDTALRGVDLLMRSARQKLELQLFGGEPTRRWDLVTAIVDHALDHPLRRGRRLEIVLTTNGLGLDADRVAWLAARPVMVLFSADGDARATARFRGAHLLDDAAAWAGVQAARARLTGSSVAWFVNLTVPPGAADEVFDRYAWARAEGVPRLQVNYSVGHWWSPEQERRYLIGLQQVLAHHADDPGGMVLFNWRSECEPVMLSDDLILDVDGGVWHDGAIFLERSLPELKRTYVRGQIEALDAFDPLRWPLAKLDAVMRGTYPEGSRERRAIEQNIRMGAKVDLVIRRARERAGPKAGGR